MYTCRYGEIKQAATNAPLARERRSSVSAVCVVYDQPGGIRLLLLICSANDCATFRIITVGRRTYERYLNLNEAILWPRLGRGCSLFRVYHALDHCERMHCERNNNGGRRNASRRSTWFERGHISALRKPRCCDPGAFPGSRNKLSDRAGRRRPTQGGCKRPPRRLSRVCIHTRREATYSMRTRRGGACTPMN